MSAPYKKKLIEVSLPLEAINRESAREKSIRHGHPSTLHLWWARRPLAACRAVLFAQLVDDPSAHPDQFPTEADQEVERKRLFDIIERLVVWENIHDEALLEEAHEEILKSTDGNPPAILDPFAGGGSIPLEAQRLGLEAHASDLNPVAVLINKALIEIPTKWADQPPVYPGAAETRMTWPKSTGLAEDVLRYGQWMREEAEKRIGHIYPTAVLPDGTRSNVIAWIWARTVKCPNPPCGSRIPLVRSWWLSKKKGQEAYVVPLVGNGETRFRVSGDPAGYPSSDNDGTVDRAGARCVQCGTSAPLAYVRLEGQAGRMDVELLAVVAEGSRRRHYLEASKEHVEAANVSPPSDVPDSDLSTHPQYMGTPRYGLTRQSDLFTPRQLNALATLSDLVREARKRLVDDALMAGLSGEGGGLESGGTGAEAYADSVATFLAFAVSRTANLGSSITSWMSDRGALRETFARQALPMVWDFAEANPLSDVGGSFTSNLARVVDVCSNLGAGAPGFAYQADARTREYSGFLVSTDPPYYDNVPYSDLSDFFYGWLRRSLGDQAPRLFSTMQTPKSEELVADQYRNGGKREASAFFEQGFRSVFTSIRSDASAKFPVTVYYAFKQVDGDLNESASTGWQTLLEAMLNAGWQITATWPMRTESPGRLRALGSNALASSILLALRPRSESSETTSRRGFVSALREELPARLRELQHGSIAPVDLAQAAIGPGMAVFSRYSRVLEADGSDMTVRTALALINQALDEVLSDQEGDFDAETRFAVKWFSQYGWNEASSGEADVLTRAVNTTVAMLERGGIFRAAAGRARLLEPNEMSAAWHPADDKSVSVWEVAVRLGHALLTEGADQAATWMRESSPRVDLDAVKELAYLMYSICERHGWTESAILFNALGTSWSDIAGVARAAAPSGIHQESLEFGDEDD